MEAAPINPSDLAILAGAADLENAEYSPGVNRRVKRDQIAV
jgi:hypothetical protein